MKAIFIMFIVFICCEIHAQRRDYNFRFMAIVMDADTAVTIPNCHIINKTQNLGTISDQFGGFMITANVGDTLVFSSMGYVTLTIAVHDSMYTNNRVIKLQPAVYVLTELDVGILSTFDRFRRDILSREAQEAYRLAHTISRYEIYTPPLPNQGGINIPISGPLASPITYFYYLLSREGRQLRHFHSVINGTAEFIIIGEKFNGYIVRQLTGLENDELIAFMSWCGFTRDFLLAASETEIRREIVRKFREYVRR